MGATSTTFTAPKAWLYFAGKLVGEELPNRVGSVVWRKGTRRTFYPYGEEKGTATPQERDKFGTYYRESVTGLDYAHQRYHASTVGRFVGADPYVAPGTAAARRGGIGMGMWRGIR